MDFFSNECSEFNSPPWLTRRIRDAGGSISFYQYMDWVLNDLDHGVYGNGQLSIGKKGDFVTSPSLSSDFAELLAIQLVDWFLQLEQENSSYELFSLVEIGPGEGDLTFDLIVALNNSSPELLKKIEFVLVERNIGMRKKQVEKLSVFSNLNIRWESLNDLARFPVVGAVIAHELLDALPVERIVFRNKEMFRQGVSVSEKNNRDILHFVDLLIPDSIGQSIDQLIRGSSLNLPPINVIDGWTTELHLELEEWFSVVSNILIAGPLLIIDYALKAKQYYAASRESGTLIAYKNQISSPNLLYQPGEWDLTSHLCLETLGYYAMKSGWSFLGQVRQGQALLSLGLAERLYSLQEIAPSNLKEALKRREALLRLVDPICLGSFYWIAFEKSRLRQGRDISSSRVSRFLQDPIC